METTQAGIPENFYLVKPWKHQRKAIEEAWGRNHYGFFFQVGTGKTLTAINTLRLVYIAEKQIKKTLILAPPIVLHNWVKEFGKNSKIKSRKIIVLYGSGINRIQIMEKLQTQDVIIITNYESLTLGATGKDKGRKHGELFKLIKSWRPYILVLDEAHRCKNGKSYRTKAAIELSRSCKYRYLLTGTPILKGPLDIHPQFRILDQGASFGWNYVHFRNKHFYQRGNSWIPTEKGLNYIKQKIDENGMYVQKEDCLDLPPLIKQVVEIPLNNEQKKIYSTVLKQVRAELSNAKVINAAGLAKVIRLQQIVTGFVNTTDGSPLIFKQNPRAQALKELLSDLTLYHKVIVWAVFKENYNTVRSIFEDLKLNYVEIHGEITPKQKFNAVEQFEKDESCRVLLGHPGSGGIGINLIAASYSIWYSRNFHLEYDLQAEARNYRGGSEKHTKITRIDLVAPGTIDEKVLKTFAKKMKISDKLLIQMVGED